MSLEKGLTLAFFLGSITLGSFYLEDRYHNDVAAEENTLKEAYRMSQGESRYGIVNYAHYPNGPTYVAATLYSLGVSSIKTMRTVPLLVSAFSFSFFLWILFGLARDRRIQIWTFVTFTFIFLQPGLVGWQGALHQHSYAISLTVVLFALSLQMPDVRWLYLGGGFVSGWIGYDFIPAQILSLLFVRFVYYYYLGERDPRWALKRAIFEALFNTVGVILAILAHLFQNTLFYGSLKQAAYDLFGSAISRVDPHVGVKIQPNTAEAMLNELGSDGQIPSRFVLFARHYKSFLSGVWVYLIPFVLGGFALLGAYLKLSPIRVPSVKWLTAAIVFAGAAAGAWTFVMPGHAYFHYHFVPRHVFLMFFSLLILAVLLSRKSNPE